MFSSLFATSIAFALAAPSVARAQAAPAGHDAASARQEAPAAVTDGPVRDEESVVVVGVMPGPGLWKVRKGDHTLWVLGTLSPLPKKMEWVSRDVDAVLAHAQEVVWQPTLSLNANIGMFQGLLLAPRALGARKNPDGATLKQVLPADLYARWVPLKQKYVGRDAGIEKWRPMFAAMELFDEALDDVGLVENGIVGPVLERAIKRHKIPETRPTVTLTIDDPKKALNEFRQAKLDDFACFDKTLERLETDLDGMRDRANAWAVGDIEALRSLPFRDQNDECMHAAMRADVVQKRVKRDFEAELRAAWLKAAEKALEKNTVSFATLPMRELLRPDGSLAQLQAKGYEIEAP